MSSDSINEIQHSFAPMRRFIFVFLLGPCQDRQGKLTWRPCLRQCVVGAIECYPERAPKTQNKSLDSFIIRKQDSRKISYWPSLLLFKYCFFNMLILLHEQYHRIVRALFKLNNTRTDWLWPLFPCTLLRGGQFISCSLGKRHQRCRRLQVRAPGGPWTCLRVDNFLMDTLQSTAPYSIIYFVLYT